MVSEYLYVSFWFHTGFCESVLPPGPADVMVHVAFFLPD